VTADKVLVLAASGARGTVTGMVVSGMLPVVLALVMVLAAAVTVTVLRKRRTRTTVVPLSPWSPDDVAARIAALGGVDTTAPAGDDAEAELTGGTVAAAEDTAGDAAEAAAAAVDETELFDLQSLFDALDSMDLDDDGAAQDGSDASAAMVGSAAANDAAAPAQPKCTSDISPPAEASDSLWALAAAFSTPAPLAPVGPDAWDLAAAFATPAPLPGTPDPAEPAVSADAGSAPTGRRAHRNRWWRRTSRTENLAAATGHDPAGDAVGAQVSAEPAAVTNVNADGVADLRSDSRWADDGATADEPERGDVHDILDNPADNPAVDLAVPSDPGGPGVAKRRKWGRRQRIEDVHAQQWDSWQSPDAFGTTAEAAPGHPDAEPVADPAIDAATPRTPAGLLPLSFEVDVDGPGYDPDEFSYLGPRDDMSVDHQPDEAPAVPQPETADSGVEALDLTGPWPGQHIDAPTADDGPRRKGLRARFRKDGAASAADDAAPTSWLAATGRSGPVAAVTPGDVVDYSRYDIPEVIPDRYSANV
jgi:hypothetical protein